MRTRTNPRPDHQEGSRTTRVMAHLRDSLVSQLKKLDPSLSLHARHSSLIERRLRDLFPAFHTPTHPPYALMIRSAILGLEDGTGSTEEAISEFIKKEYSDLPWAHARILGLQLEKLCEIGEIARVSGCRYVLKVEDEVKEQCEGSEKKKRGKRRSNKRGEAENAEEECKKERVLELVKQSQQHQELVTQKGLVESQNQDSSLHRETTCSSQPTQATEFKCIPAAANPLSPAQLQLQKPCNGTSESNLDLDTVDKISDSLCLNVDVCKQDKTVMTVHHHQSREREPSGFKQIADHEGESLLLPCDTTVAEQDQKESRDAPNSHVNPSHNFGQQLSVSTSEGYPEGTISAEIKLPPTQVQHEISSDIDLGRLSRRKVSSTLGDVHHDQPQYYNEGSLKGNIEEDPMSWDYEQRPTKRPRGRPRKLHAGANCAVVSLLPSDDGNLHEHKPNINEMEKRGQYGEGRGLGRFGQGRGRGRPPILNRNANQCDELLQQGHSKQLGRGRGRGRGSRGRPPKLNENPIQYDKQPQQEDQYQQHGRGRGRPSSEVQAKNQYVRARGRGRGRPPKSNQRTNQFEDQLQYQDQAEDVLNSPSLDRNNNKNLEQKQLNVQSPIRTHELESGETPESNYGSGEVSRSNVEEKDNPWRLMPVQRKVQGIDGCWPLKPYQK